MSIQKLDFTGIYKAKIVSISDQGKLFNVPLSISLQLHTYRFNEYE